MAFPAFTEMYDKIVYDNPGILVLFASGNERRNMSINSPSDSKNILAVGATKSLISRDLDDYPAGNTAYRHSYLRIGEGDDQYDITVSTCPQLNIWNLTITKPSMLLDNVEFIDYDDSADLRGKIVRYVEGKIASKKYWATIKKM